MFPPPERRLPASPARRPPGLLSLLLSLLLLPPRCAALPRTASPRILTVALGWKNFQFNTTEKHIAVYHEEGSSSVFVGAENKLYYYNFEDSTSHVERFDVDISRSMCENQEEVVNYLTFIGKYQGKLLICGTNACKPTCWNWVDGQKEPGISAQSLAPFGLDKNSLVLIDGNDIYSTIRKYQYNGRIPRFRRVRGSAELYTSDTVMKNPEFVKIVPIQQEEAYNGKIYIFFREDNPDWPNNPLAPRKISRVAQVCKGDKGGSGSFSAAKWTTFLKSTLVCADLATNRNFDWLQDVFIVELDQTMIYGLFVNEWGYSAVCVYSVSDISDRFRKSPLKNYSGKPPAVKPGQCLEGTEKTPPETFKVIDSYPEVATQMNGKIIFYSKHHYQQLGVHQVRAANNENYDVLYLATDKGSIHKVVVLPDGPMNILEIQPFHSQVVILAMILDKSRNELIVASANEVVQLPMASCGAYRDNCESCVLSRDPYCGWVNEKCTSINEHENGTLLQSLSHDVPRNICPTSNNLTSEGDDSLYSKIVNVALHSRYFLNCSQESHYANYTWLHNDRPVAHCSSGHRHCFHFIDNMTHELYGKYSCVSKEDWFHQTVITNYLENPSQDRGYHHAKSVGLASIPSLSFWLGLLHMIAIVFIVQ